MQKKSVRCYPASYLQASKLSCKLIEQIARTYSTVQEERTLQQQQKVSTVLPIHMQRKKKVLLPDQHKAHRAEHVATLYEDTFFAVPEQFRNIFGRVACRRLRRRRAELPDMRTTCLVQWRTMSCYVGSMWHTHPQKSLCAVCWSAKAAYYWLGYLVGRFQLGTAVDFA